MNRWWRAYDLAVDNPKLQRLSGDLFKSWFNLCCLASANDGKLPSIADIAFKLRVSEAKAGNVIETLHCARLIDKDGDSFLMHDWSEYQYKSDVSTPRVKRYREQQRLKNETADETFQDCSEKRSQSVSVSSTLPVSLELEEPQREQASGQFDQFWKIFPNKIGKDAARKSFDKALKRVEFSTLIEALVRYVNKTDDRPWCIPTTWLNQGRWNDEPAQVQGNGTDRDTIKSGYRQALQRLTEYAESPSADGDICEAPVRLLPSAGRG